MTWRVLSYKYLLQNRWLTVRQDKVQQPSSRIIDDFYVLEYPDWVNVIAINKQGQFIIERQYRHGISEIIYEICAGAVEAGEKPLVAAKRELLEETGYGDGHWEMFMVSAPNTNSMNNRCYSFLATDVELLDKPMPEETEDIEVLLMEKQQVKELIVQNKILEADMCAPLWKYFSMNK